MALCAGRRPAISRPGAEGDAGDGNPGALLHPEPVVARSEQRGIEADRHLTLGARTEALARPDGAAALALQDGPEGAGRVELEIEGEDGAAAEQYEPGGRPASGSSQTRAGQVSYSGGAGTAQPSALAAAASGAGAAIAPEGYPVEGPEEPLPVVEQRRVAADEQIGRNDPCWCGSGKKFKRCHGA